MKNKFVINVKTRPNTNHTFLVGDCLERLNELSNKVDLIITDPPYNIGLNYGVFKDSMKENEYFDYVEKRIEKAASLLKDSGSIYIITYPEIAAHILLYFKNNLKFRRWITWHYPTNIGNSKKNFTRSQRTILFFTKSDRYIFNKKWALRPYKNPDDKRIRKLIKNGSKGRMMYDTIFDSDLNELKDFTDIFKVNILKNVSKDRQNWHPCQLPLSILRLLIFISSNTKDTILDPFAGTFSTSMAAMQLGRNSIGVDVNVDFVKLGMKRLIT